MQANSYQERRAKLTTYFDETASAAWSKLTSDAPVGRVRASVRAGRDAMRANLLSWLPADMTGMRLLDAGCGTGAVSVAAAARGAEVVAVDVSESLIGYAKQRTPDDLAERIHYRVGDMLDTAHGNFDYVLAMDSMIHYPVAEIVDMLVSLGARTSSGMLITFAPRTAALTVMHAVGRLIPYMEHRAPAIEPVAEPTLLRLLGSEPAMANWRAAGSRRINSGFYKSQALKLEQG